MQINTLNNILFLTFPEDIIGVISSYLIKKIPKHDTRCSIIEKYLIYKQRYLRQEFYLDGEFHYNLFQFEVSLKRYFLLRSFPTLFIEYHCCIDDRISSIRFWIKDNKCEVPVDGRWTNSGGESS
jgi:hypothetical protein